MAGTYLGEVLQSLHQQPPAILFFLPRELSTTTLEMEDTRMGMFSDLMNKIFHHAPATTNTFGGAQSQPAGSTGSAGGAAVAEQVDVEAILDKLAAGNAEKLDWKHSIVDMMKLVGMDSSLASRKALAGDLNYSGDTNDSATMNLWLHKEVMQKLAQNGGKVPASLLAR